MPTPRAASLHQLVKEPFGPYWDHQVLTPLCKSVPKNVLVLNDVAMSRGNSVIG